MNFKKILTPTDFSSASEGVMRLATALARDSGGSLLIAHVEQLPIGFGGGEAAMFVEPTPRNELTASLERVVPTDPAVRYEHRLLIGDPAREIVRLAADEGVDLIVMGTHGRGGLTRLLMGSVAEEVVRRAECPVLTVKLPHRAAARAS
jgi:nucleotide-binding universal stress UspA family protein